MTFARDYLALDWGTTNRRTFVVRGGTVARVERDGRGVTAIAAGGFEAEAATLRERLGDAPMLMAGMVGSALGWRETPYLPVPVGLDDLAARLSFLDERTAIVPGVATRTGGRCDVMRGEEVQLLGAVAAGLVPPDALLAQPGTHCKWARLSDGRITGFTTAMTGEMFALVRRHGLLATQLGGEVTPGDAFRDGVAAAGRRDLLASLFEIRAAKLLGARDDADAASYASGLLIGSDVAARLDAEPGGEIHLLADPALGALYAVAIAHHGGTAHLIDSQAAFIAGITAIGDRA